MTAYNQGGEAPSLSSNENIQENVPSQSEVTIVNYDRPVEEDARMEEELHELARRYTTASNFQGSLFPHQADSPLDPSSKKFNARKWAKAFYDLRVDTAEGSPPRTTGIAFKNLNVHGFGTSTDFQKDVGNAVLEVGSMLGKVTGKKQHRIDILHNLEGLVQAGELLAVLGPPGSGCSTFLKTVAGDTHGFHVDPESTINYQGIHPNQMRTSFRGEAIYTAEVDNHFAHLTVGDTLYFAARTRMPKNIPPGVSKKEYAEHLRDVTMAMFGISHTINTKVGDDFVRGVSGGERKRVTIAEAALSYSPLQCWDNSTRGLDSANAIEFVRTLRTQSDIMSSTSAVAIYQAPQDAYDLFHKVIVLYEGRQIYFGPTGEARAYFEELGFVCPDQQTTADFLTSMTSHQERIVRPGWEGKTPRSPDEFAQAWKNSRQRAALMVEIDNYIEQHPFHGQDLQKFAESRRKDQSKIQRAKSPFTLSFIEQMSITLWRSLVMLKNDPSTMLTSLSTNTFQALIIGSIFYNLSEDTSSFFKRGTLLFFLILMNAFGSILEILSLYSKRKIVEKHARYALYRPSAEALSAMIADLPYKIVNAIIMNSILYFMGNLRREAGAYFFFLLISFAMTLSMSMLFRLIGSVTKTISAAMAPASIILLAIVLYTGYAIPVQYMQVWLGWLRWINPVYYGLESVMLNEFFGRQFTCNQFIPAGGPYGDVPSASRVCTAVGSVPGQPFVTGAAYLESSYNYLAEHKWRNLGVIIAFTILFMAMHLVATEYVASERSKGEVLVFTRKALKARKHQEKSGSDIEMSNPGRQYIEESEGSPADMEKQTSVFHWKDVCYDIKIKGEPRRILDHVDGWVKPGTLTALMGVSGAGKTTLLDVLASRVTMGVISGSMLVDGQARDSSFQRKTGYVQQQDLHLHTSTVREALSFSALLRQPAHYTKKEKLDYVETVINMLGMEEYADAVIGFPGEGLNVEQRKRLTIGVELAARPQLLLFLDEPTSGLDSQTSWSICNLMEKLTRNGQAILCTIHQPSAILFQRFDRLLLLAKGGRTVYFGEIGKNSKTLMDYFARNGGPKCPEGANPAEHMLEVIGAAPGAHTDIDWPAVWRESPEYQGVQAELARLSGTPAAPASSDKTQQYEFAAGMGAQMIQVTKRMFQQYWRSPSLIMSKGILSFGTALFIGLSFLNAENSMRGLQNQMFGVFLFLSIFGQILNQIMPNFVNQRTMYEARERPSKTYSWQSFMFANVAVEMAWNSLMGLLCFICWYFPMGLYRNAYATDTVDSRGATMFLQVWIFFIFVTSFAFMGIAALPNAEVAGNIVNLFVIMMFSFCGVLAGPTDLPGFWIFMYRVNPFTYVVESFLGTGLADTNVICASNEFVNFNPTNGTCGEYMAPYISAAGGYLQNPSATSDCSYCAMDKTNTFLASLNINPANTWRNFGLMWAYIVFNLGAAVALYWLVRVPKRKVRE
ncbi:hypothetical protein MCOR27_000739 [Pyricularia oryzae]|uniref:ABC transporter domain-containing protein n=1 Tax=Pyricularia grisea TaxID=148305 RepID=A0ABQ8NEY4_PYRGI|nr:hypothetical protein MCOR19_003929 [Pyricularia oryzae]KAI6294687.1 hypothetical protein MCOR33_008253 [Pyricularia grisea]KAI6278011.1 hypothetical protein MCOR26_004884 [Pyricularia oryzae]KAI6288652.1 hypothetical protein MCOR27_000739 [Pyricularia oryzae]KAI6333402.1 hypothetical protein MCOR29_000969 [Pyricularia oryzae]